MEAIRRRIELEGNINRQRVSLEQFQVKLGRFEPFSDHYPALKASLLVRSFVRRSVTLVDHFKKVMHRKWAYLKSRLAFTMAMFNILVEWDGIQVDEFGNVHFSLAPFSL